MLSFEDFTSWRIFVCKPVTKLVNHLNSTAAIKYFWIKRPTKIWFKIISGNIMYKISRTEITQQFNSLELLLDTITCCMKTSMIVCWVLPFGLLQQLVSEAAPKQSMFHRVAIHWNYVERFINNLYALYIHTHLVKYNSILPRHPLILRSIWADYNRLSSTDYYRFH